MFLKKYLSKNRTKTKIFAGFEKAND